MKIEHTLRRGDLNLDEIRERVSDRVGRPLGMVSSAPTADGPGVLMFEEMGTDQRVAVDPRIVVSVVDGMGRELDQTRAHIVTETRRSQDPDHVHAVPDVPPIAGDRLAAFDAAATDEERFAVIRAYFAYAAGREDEFRAQVAADIAAACADGSAPCTLSHPHFFGNGHGHGH